MFPAVKVPVIIFPVGREDGVGVEQPAKSRKVSEQIIRVYMEYVKVLFIPYLNPLPVTYCIRSHANWKQSTEALSKL